jgi:hypothetical protein
MCKITVILQFLIPFLVQAHYSCRIDDSLEFLASFNNGRHYVANDDKWTGKYARKHLINILVPSSFNFQFKKHQC